MARDDEGQQVITQFASVHLALGLGVHTLKQQVQQIGRAFMAARDARLDGIVGH